MIHNKILIKINLLLFVTIKATNENNANSNVSIINRTRNSSLYLILIMLIGQLNRDLLEVSLPVLSDDVCFNKYRLPDKRTGFCAGETGANMDTCQG